MEIKVKWGDVKKRIFGYARDLVLILSMWTIWLTDVYMPEGDQQILVRIYQIIIIVIIILSKEFVDYQIIAFEHELNEIKNRK